MSNGQRHMHTHVDSCNLALRVVGSTSPGQRRDVCTETNAPFVPQASRRNSPLATNPRCCVLAAPCWCRSVWKVTWWLVSRHKVQPVSGAVRGWHRERWAWGRSTIFNDWCKCATKELHSTRDLETSHAGSHLETMETESCHFCLLRWRLVACVIASEVRPRVVQHTHAQRGEGERGRES